MSSEKESRARQQHIHELRNQLKGRIHEAELGTDQHRKLIRQLAALDADNDAAQMQWFDDLTATHPLPPTPE
ncbi:hypothetical protein [Paeniglutamicibacter antarcticus]|uniref:Uncharacterized protein n=1 Tax=Paeniglutamicibacter antarcticus TaxID=494023 RepID=A0ABP9TMM5_9MICC